MGEGELTQFRLVIVMPVYRDAVSAARLLEALLPQFKPLGIQLRILMVDDGSPVPLLDELQLKVVAPGCGIEVLRLRRNVGHQRAIALGAALVHEQIPCDAMLVMDADGEDRPEDAVRLVQRFRELVAPRIVFAERTRRSESWLFCVLYRCFQISHWLLTGIRVRVGNFSIVPARFLPALATQPAMWNHYAAAIFHSRLPFEMIPTRRGQRLDGRSQMNYFSLIMHGLHAISVFCDIVGVRLLMLVFSLACLCGGLLLTSPSWALYGWGALMILLLVTLGCFSLVLNLMSQRNSLDFLPVRDYKYFIEYLRPAGLPHE